MENQQVIAKWNLVIDVEKCENCNNCFLADKDEYCGNTFPGYSESQPRHGHRWINILKRERGTGSLVDMAYVPTMCGQCTDAPCVQSCKDGEIYQREDGIVIIDPVKAKGQKRLVKSCPHGHIWWNEELELPQKWFFDAHLLDAGWKQPRCVQSCGTGAMQSMKISDEEMKAKAAKDGLDVLGEEHETQPRVWYKNLYRYTKEHVAGSVVMTIDGIEECAEAAQVVLSKGDEVIQELTTDFFGDFKFDALDANSGEYTITATKDALSGSVSFELKESVNLGVIALA
ncbi:4Fe-4S dicluster domain-containing protein [Vibrio sp. RC27]